MDMTPRRLVQQNWPKVYLKNRGIKIEFYQIDFEPIGRGGRYPADQSLLDCAHQLGIDIVSILYVGTRENAIAGCYVSVRNFDRG